MPEVNFRMLAAESEAAYEIKRSRFFACAVPVASEDEAQAIIHRQKKKYFDARHNSSAWVLGERGERQKSNDDGEPGGTAGNPILEAIKGRNLTNTIVVVTRYFGGIKLGTGGLVRAYGHTAALALEMATFVRLVRLRRVSIGCAYPLLAPIQNFLRQKNIRIGSEAYTDKVTLSLLLPPDESEAILAALTELTAANFTYEELGEETLAVGDG